MVPARVRRPRDKPLAENGVQQVERWVLAPLRNRTFFSLDELNAAMAEKLTDLNDRPLSADKTRTRAKLFEEHEKPMLKGLPAEPFVIGRWERYKLGPDYHVRIDGVAYSAPFGLIGKPVDVHCTGADEQGAPAIFDNGKPESCRKMALSSARRTRHGNPSVLLLSGRCGQAVLKPIGDRLG